MCSETSEAVGTTWEHAQLEFQKFLKIRIALFRRYDEEGLSEPWTWLPVEGVFQDLRSNVQFFFEEPEGTNHSLTIQNLDFETKYEVKVEVFNTFAWTEGPRLYATTPPGSYHT